MDRREGSYEKIHEVLTEGVNVGRDDNTRNESV